MYSSGIKSFGVLVFGMITMIAVGSCNYLSNVKLLRGGSFTENNYQRVIPFNYIKGLIVVEGTVNSDTTQRQFIFDTGAFNSKIEEGLADSQGMKTYATKDNSTAQGNTRKIEVTRIDSLWFGDALFRKIGAGKLSYDPNSASPCIADDGIIGANLIKLAHWKIDYQDKELMFSDNPFEPGETALTIPFKRPVLSGVPEIKLRVGDRTVEGVLFDVGYNGGLILPAQFADAFDSSNKQIVIDRSTTGIYGTNTDTLISKILEVTIQDFTTEIPVEFSSIGKALLGNDFLEHFDVFINYKRKEISLVPVNEVEIPDSYEFIPGVLNDSLWIVNRSTLESDLQLGGTLRTINGMKPLDIFPNYCDYVMRIGLLLQEQLEIISQDGISNTIDSN